MNRCDKTQNKQIQEEADVPEQTPADRTDSVRLKTTAQRRDAARQNTLDVSWTHVFTGYCHSHRLGYYVLI